MKMTSQQFLHWQAKRITLLAMSGGGKTTLANKLPKDKWFHYCADYRIGTKYLNEAILDNIKRQAMEVPFLRKLLRSDSIYIHNNITVDNLSPVSSFLGKLGDAEQDGLPLAEFKRRQKLHYIAEVGALNDVAEFIHKAEDIYGYKHFLNDVGGSICELDRPDVLENLAKHSLIIYLKIPESLEQTVIDRALRSAKPLYYREEFLDEQLAQYLQKLPHNDPDKISPNDFSNWIFPALFRERKPRYQAIADQYGYTVCALAASKITGEDDFVQLIAAAIAGE